MDVDPQGNLTKMLGLRKPNDLPLTLGNVMSNIVSGVSGNIHRWNKNGNAPTLEAYSQLDTETQNKTLTFLKSRPVYTDMYVNNRMFFLMHGFPGSNIHDSVWNRPEIDTVNPVPEATLIVGHTPVPNLLYPNTKDEDIIAVMAAKGGVSPNT